MRELLTGLVLNGRKCATAGLLADFAPKAERLEHVAVLNNDRRPVPVEITRSTFSRLRQSPVNSSRAKAMRR
jgi:hypothetical protein